MKISTVILAAALLGLVHYAGPAGWESCHRGGLDPLDGGAVSRASFPHLFVPSESVADHGSPGLRQLKAREAEIGRKIRDAESALGKLESTERYLKRRLKELADEQRRFNRSYKSSEERIRPGSQETLLLAQFQKLEGERRVFLDLLGRLKSEQVTAKVHMELFSLEADKVGIQKFLGQDVRSPLDELKEEIKHTYRLRAF